MKACPQCRLKYPSDIQTCFVDGRVLEEMPDPRVGTTIAGRYNIEAVIGEGGMATVYKAHHRLVDRPCAIKVMSRDFADNEVVKERFRREARAAQKLAHPNIIEIFDQGDLEDGSLYLVMELLEGETLAERIAQGKPDLRDALPIGVQIARALARAHDLEVIHRDLKPDNVFLVGAAGGPVTVKLLDFGIARSTRDTRLTGAGEVFGTPQYMAPERIVSIDAGPAADLYALGIILFEMTTGTLPFDARDVPGFFVQHLKVPPPPLRSKDPGLPEALERLVLELLEKDPERRPVDARQVHAELLELARSLDIEVAPEARSGEALPPGPANTLPPVALDAWVRRTKLFEQMLTRAYPGEPPGELAALLSQVRELVDQIALAR
ncbi:MAG TPA: serine/threonine-protein kinase, partial [Polyangiaceae bacterium]|nr:serine/threonine-protein kinase [Polyangiaceae bacterium]